MKKVLYFLAAAAATLGTIACNKDLNSSAPSQNQLQLEEGQKCELTVGIAGRHLTKATGSTADDEVAVKILQIFVFRGDALDAYTKVSSATEATLSCTAGDRVIYALVNDVDRSSIKTKTELLAAVSNYSNTLEGGFAMIGSESKKLPQNSTVTINVDRLASRVVVNKITRNFTSAALAAQDLKIEKIWIQNVAADINFGLTAAPTTWLNKMNLDAQTNKYLSDAPNASVANSSAYETPHTFFCYPNPTADDSSEATWCARHSRLVVQVKLGTDTYYYPITLPVLEYNKSYEIANLTLTRPGSDNPDVPVTFQDCTFDINIQPWTVVPVTEGLTI